MPLTPQSALRILIDDDRLAIDDTVLTSRPNVEQLRRALGAHPRQVSNPLAPKLTFWIWDQFGIVAYGDNRRRVWALRFYYIPERGSETCPAKEFTGDISIGGVRRFVDEPLDAFLQRLVNDKSGRKLRLSPVDHATHIEKYSLSKWSTDDQYSGAGEIRLWHTDTDLACWIEYFFPTKLSPPNMQRSSAPSAAKHIYPIQGGIFAQVKGGGFGWECGGYFGRLAARATVLVILVIIYAILQAH